ncbi:MAG TPA: PVC-type heme-binding CxxCH protein [Planctomycetota bacterium]|nr:PVC-type heme-binding CxxCH protein [Planctomycetota bacterium]
MRVRAVAVLMPLLLACVFLRAEADRPGEAQPEPRIKLPPSPPLSPEQALQSFKLQPGFRIELVASEPLIQDPVAMTFDGDGRIWAVEFIGYMPNPEGKGEDAPVGNVVVLEDTNADWKMDKRTVFLDKLVLPRAIGLVKGGVLVAEVPRLLYCRDKDGDLKCDEQTLVAADYGTTGNPEHSANGLLSGLDNWIYSADFNYRFRYEVASDGTLKWMRSKVSMKGQWGLSQDDLGRFYYNNNSEILRADCVPSHYFSRNPALKSTTGINVLAVKDQSAWPCRPTPGVNRGYRAGQLRDDSTLATVTAACGPGVYRADQFPDEFRGNVFVCEPSAHLVKRTVMTEENGLISGRNPYEKTEFLSSTDERFRPVNTYTGPDGALYIVDLYRGIIEHRLFLTTYLRKQIMERGLDKPIGLGRIYRVVHEGKPVSTVHPRMSADSAADLVKHLQNPNGWWRDTAQRLLVERADREAVAPLRELALSASESRARVHALWTLEGMNKLDLKTLTAALSAEDVHVKANAIRLCEVTLKTPQGSPLLEKLLEITSDKRAEIQLQLAFTLGESADPKATAALASILAGNVSNPLIFDAVFSSLAGRELEVAQLLVSHPDTNLDKALSLAAGCTFASRRSDRISKLIDLIAACKNPSRQAAMLSGIIPPAPAKGKAPVLKGVEMQTPPATLEQLKNSADKRVADTALALAKLIVPPGTLAAAKKLPPLTEDQRAIYDHGKTHYMQICAQCHQPSGAGEEGKAPPFIDSEWVDFSDERLVRIVLNGIRGPMSVNGREYNMEMPAVPQLDDKTIAGCLTYIRREFGKGKPVEPATVTRIRKELGSREEQWTEAEILKIK